MNRAFLTLLLGLIAGISAHLSYYEHHQHPATHTLEGQLVWMRTELNLTQAQFERIKELHQASHPKLQEMTAQVAQMQFEFAEFERNRRKTDRVDFLEFARFVENRRELNRECFDSTRQLILASAEIMTPEQRQHYIRLVSTVEPHTGALLN